MRLFILSLIVCICGSLHAQDSNIFLQRSFWKGKPSVEDIQQKIKEGHDPAESGSHGFDGVSYGIIDDAPLESIAFMLEQEGNPLEKPTHGGVSYLLWASYKGNLPVMEHLIGKGANVHMATSRGTNILSMAAIGGVEDKKVYDLIFSNGVKVAYNNSIGSNALHLLAGSGADDKAIYTYLAEKGISWDSKDQEGNGIFNYAARGGNMDIMKWCVEKGLDYTSLNTKGENALFFAAYGRKRSTIQLETFKYLEELGLDVDVVNWEGQSPLHHAIRRADVEVLEFFLERGVNVNQIDKYGNTALINAAGGKLPMLEKILPLVDDVNHQNHKGHSALNMAILRSSTSSFDLLVEHGADIQVVDERNNNLFYHAFKNFSPKREKTTEHFIQALSEKGLKLTDGFYEGNSLAHLAVEKNSPYLLEKAISLGANINQTNEMGLSPLHLAAMTSTDGDLISILLDAGADKNILTEFEESAYELATENEMLDKNEVSLSSLKID
ncbi:MAG: ankyrin repeat domain-containing protein [Bacteroidota bacterium]